MKNTLKNSYKPLQNNPEALPQPPKTTESLCPTALPYLPPSTPTITVLRDLNMVPPRLISNYMEVKLQFKVEKLRGWQKYFDELLLVNNNTGLIHMVFLKTNGNGVSTYIKHKVTDFHKNTYLDDVNMRVLNHSMHKVAASGLQPENIFLDFRFTPNGDVNPIIGLKNLSDGLFSATPHYPRPMINEFKNIVVFSPYVHTHLAILNPNKIQFYELDDQTLSSLEYDYVVKYTTQHSRPQPHENNESSVDELIVEELIN